MLNDCNVLNIVLNNLIIVSPILPSVTKSKAENKLKKLQLLQKIKLKQRFNILKQNTVYDMCCFIIT